MDNKLTSIGFRDTEPAQLEKLSGPYCNSGGIEEHDFYESDQVRIEHYQKPSAYAAGEDQILVCDDVVTIAANYQAIGDDKWKLISQV